jgi:preprotein translocase subunit SecA
LQAIQRQVVYAIYKLAATQAQMLNTQPSAQALRYSAPSKEAVSQKSPFAQEVATRQEQGKKLDDKSHFNDQKVGRNEPCPCGSGKKFKQCHGK